MLENQEQHWHLLGAGSIGCLWATWLNKRCTLIQRPSSQKHNCENFNFTLKNFYGEEEAFSIKNLRSRNAEIKNLLICTKSHQTLHAIEPLNIAKNANIVLMQNGMGNHLHLKTKYPDATIFCGSTTHGAYKKSADILVHAGLGDTFIGVMPPDSNFDHCQFIARSLSNSQERVKAEQDIEHKLWLKLAINCAINPLTAIYQCKNGALLENSEYLSELGMLCKEIDWVLHAKGFIEDNKSCLETVVQVAKDTGNNFSSMCQDIRNKQTTEIDYIQGYLLKEAKTLKLRLPHSESVYSQVKQLESTFHA